MKDVILRSAMVGLCAILMFLISAASLSAETWVWQADNYTEKSVKFVTRGNHHEEMADVSYFTDGKTSFTMTAEGGGKWFWDDPAPGMVSNRNLVGWQRYAKGRGRAVGRTSDFGEALDINKGITVAARVKPVSAFSEGTLCLSIANSSTANLPYGSTHLWVGWDVPDMVWLCKWQVPTRLKLRTFDSSVKFEGRWCVWTLAAKRIGDTVAWDVWIDGVQQKADQVAPDRTLHTLVCTQSTNYGTTVSIGERYPMVWPHDTAWDYVAITNEGVIPGWTGNVEPGKDVEPSALPQWHQDMLTKSAIWRVERLLKDYRYAEVVETCQEALTKYETTEPTWRMELIGFQVSALVREGRVDEGVAAIGAMLAETTASAERAMLLQWIGQIYFGAKRYSEAAETYRDVIRVDSSKDGHGKARYHLGVCYRELGYNDLARNYMEGVIERYPESEWAKKAREILYLWQLAPAAGMAAENGAPEHRTNQKGIGDEHLMRGLKK